EFLGQLFETGEEDLALDLIVNVLAEFALDDRLGRLAGPKAGNPRLADELLEFLLEAGVNVGPMHGDLDVLLARTHVLDVHGLLELLLFFRRRIRHRSIDNIRHGKTLKMRPWSVVRS